MDRVLATFDSPALVPGLHRAVISAPTPQVKINFNESPSFVTFSLNYESNPKKGGVHIMAEGYLNEVKY